MRIFFGATLPENTKLEITKIQEELRSLIPFARLEGRQKLHITLQFIGEFKREEINQLFSSVAEKLKKSQLRFSETDVYGLNYFPNEKVRRGIWLDCRDGGTLSGVAELIKSVMGQFGVQAESRAFKPHITIARLKDQGGGKVMSHYIDLQKFWAGGKLSVERFFPVSVALFESTLNPDRSGCEYTILDEYQLT